MGTPNNSYSQFSKKLGFLWGLKLLLDQQLYTSYLVLMSVKITMFYDCCFIS